MYGCKLVIPSSFPSKYSAKKKPSCLHLEVASPPCPTVQSMANVLSYIAQMEEQYLKFALISSHCLFSNAHRLAFSQKTLHKCTAICAVADATLARYAIVLINFASRTQADIHNHPAAGSCNNSSSRLAIFLNKHFNTMKISSGLKWSLLCWQCLSLHLQRSVQCCRVICHDPIWGGCDLSNTPFQG